MNNFQFNLDITRLLYGQMKSPDFHPWWRYAGISFNCWSITFNLNTTYTLGNEGRNTNYILILGRQTSIILMFCWPCVSVIDQLDAQNFCFTISLFHASTCFEHMCSSSGGQPVHKTATYSCDDTRGCVMQFWPLDEEHMCSKHVEAWNKTYCKTKILWIKLVNYWDKERPYVSVYENFYGFWSNLLLRFRHFLPSCGIRTGTITVHL